jgi:prepilin-type N-terminal cleavage/methylation domain-containing protein/prepilin-type processing-associated H-X9-DG protein
VVTDLANIILFLPPPKKTLILAQLIGIKRINRELWILSCNIRFLRLFAEVVLGIFRFRRRFFVYSTRTAMDKRRGFTLVELLVVIAIIALLMSILMPALGRVRKQAKAVLCQSNQRQWGAIFTMYTNEFNGRFMPNWNSAIKPEDYWMEALRPYYSDAGDIRCCPMATKPSTEEGGTPGNNLGPFFAWGIFPEGFWPVAVITGDFGSYGTNGYISDPREGTVWEMDEGIFWRTMDVKDASRVPMFCGDQWLAGFPGEKNNPALYQNQPWNADASSVMVRLCPNRHDGYVNQVFLDCSVQKIGLKQLWTLKWHRRFKTDDFWTLAGGVTRDDWPEWMRNFKDY